MSYADETRLILEARNLLAKQRNKDAVVNYYTNRGMAPDQAREMIYSIYQENLSENRKAPFGWLLGGGACVVVFIFLLFVGGWVTLFSLLGIPVGLIIFIVGVGRFFIARGYEMDEAD
jgi:hypothetical protein